MARKIKTLYEIIDVMDPLELPKFSGTLSEVAEHTGVAYHNINMMIWRKKKFGGLCRYVRVDLDEDEQFVDEEQKQ